MIFSCFNKSCKVKLGTFCSRVESAFEFAFLLNGAAPKSLLVEDNQAAAIKIRIKWNTADSYFRLSAVFFGVCERCNILHAIFIENFGAL